MGIYTFRIRNLKHLFTNLAEGRGDIINLWYLIKVTLTPLQCRIKLFENDELSVGCLVILNVSACGHCFNFYCEFCLFGERLSNLVYSDVHIAGELDVILWIRISC